MRAMPDASPVPEPFIPQTGAAELADLRARLRATRWPDAPEDVGWSLVRVTEPPRGGHFAPFEEPELYAEELRAFFRPYRSPGNGQAGH